MVLRFVVKLASPALRHFGCELPAQSYNRSFGHRVVAASVDVVIGWRILESKYSMEGA